MLGELVDPLAWLSVGAFLVAAVVEFYDRDWGRYLSAGAWVVFAVFWAVLVPEFLLVEKSAIEAVLSAVAVPASISAAYLLARGRESLLTLTRGVAVMGLLYLPATTVPWIAEPLVELTTAQTNWLIELSGHDPRLTTGEQGYLNTFTFSTNGHQYTTFIILACTGLGSMAIFAGMIAAVRAPLDRKLKAFALSVPVIWVLNVVRNWFIAVAFGKQWFQVGVPQVMAAFGTADPHMVSYYLADRVLAQSLSVLALVAITWLVVRELPEVLTVVEDVLFVLTGSEYDLIEALDVRGNVEEAEPAIVRAERPGDD